jgi:acetyl-CoA acetyltransferase
VTSADRTPVIVGVGMSDGPVAPHLDAVQHHVLAMRRALEDSGVDKREIDGYFCAGASKSASDPDDLPMMAEYLGIDHRWCDSTMVGGSSFEFAVQHASAAIRAGDCDTVLMTYGSDLVSRQGRMLGSKGYFGAGTRVPGPPQYEVPYGNVLIGAYAMAARRHMHEYGTTPEQLAEIAVAIRGHAALNPAAMYRDPITVDDVLASRPIADPLRKLDCCVITDGGGAVVMTTAERARDLRQPPVYVHGAAGAQSHWNISEMPDFTTTAAVEAGATALRQAGVTPADIDTVQLYDSFTITVLLLLEDLGFCPKGEGGRFVESGAIRLGDKLPVNTDGGGLSALHPGMRGIFLLIEATRQLRHQAGAAQVPDCELALVCGSGAFLSAMGAVVLGREAR